MLSKTFLSDNLNADLNLRDVVGDLDLSLITLVLFNIQLGTFATQYLEVRQLQSNIRSFTARVPARAFRKIPAVSCGRRRDAAHK